MRGIADRVSIAFAKGLLQRGRYASHARTESLPESRLLLYGLGLLEMEVGHAKEARDAFQEFLSISEGMAAKAYAARWLESSATTKKNGHAKGLVKPSDS